MGRRFIDKTAMRKVFAPEQWTDLGTSLNVYRARNSVIVLACGCFDILHVGHVRLLRAAADLGDILVVGLNSDASIKRLKGPNRPIINQQERMEMIASLDGVNFVSSFCSDNPSFFIDLVSPNIYVKGGDYASRYLPEASAVTENGGHIVFLTYHPEHSTTGLLARLEGENK